MGTISSSRWYVRSPESTVPKKTLSIVEALVVIVIVIVVTVVVVVTVAVACVGWSKTIVAVVIAAQHTQ